MLREANVHVCVCAALARIMKKRWRQGGYKGQNEERPTACPSVPFDSTCCYKEGPIAAEATHMHAIRGVVGKYAREETQMKRVKANKQAKTAQIFHKLLSLYSQGRHKGQQPLPCVYVETQAELGTHSARDRDRGRRKRQQKVSLYLSLFLLSLFLSPAALLAGAVTHQASCACYEREDLRHLRRRRHRCRPCPSPTERPTASGIPLLCKCLHARAPLMLLLEQPRWRERKHLCTTAEHRRTTIC